MFTPQVEQGNIWMECVVQKTTLPALQRFLKVPSATATADDLSHRLAHADADADADDARSGRGSHSGDPPTGEASHHIISFRALMCNAKDHFVQA